MGKYLFLCRDKCFDCENLSFHCKILSFHCKILPFHSEIPSFNTKLRLFVRKKRFFESLFVFYFQHNNQLHTNKQLLRNKIITLFFFSFKRKNTHTCIVYNIVTSIISYKFKENATMSTQFPYIF